DCSQTQQIHAEEVEARAARLQCCPGLDTTARDYARTRRWRLVTPTVPCALPVGAQISQMQLQMAQPAVHQPRQPDGRLVGNGIQEGHQLLRQVDTAAYRVGVA